MPHKVPPWDRGGGWESAPLMREAADFLPGLVRAYGQALVAYGPFNGLSVGFGTATWGNQDSRALPSPWGGGTSGRS